MEWNVKLDTGDKPEFGEHFNPAQRYEASTVAYSPRELALLRCVRKAVRNGWQGWRSFVNDATTIGLEPEAVLRDMRKAQAPVEPLIFNHEFAKALWGELWAARLTNMVTAEDRIKWLSENVD
jgi:hypothetical protein